MAAMKPLKNRVRSERGAELIEFALVFPLLLLLVLGMVDFGFLFQRYEVLTNAAREGARMAALADKYTQTDVTNRVQAYLTSGGVPWTKTTLSVSLSDQTITTSDGTKLAAKQVTVAYTNAYLFIGPIAQMFGGSFTTVPITTVATMRKEP
jgi:Flp pilus assembly protein TadG